MMTVDCIILNYNDAKTTMDLANQISGYSVLSHIILVDNCSTDDSFEQMKKIACDRIIVLKSDRNGGYGYGNNVGIRYAYNVHQAEYSLIANPDTMITQESIEVLLNVLKSNPMAAAAAPIALMMDGNIQKPIAWRIPAYHDFLIFSSVALNKLFKPMLYKSNHYANKSLCEVECLSGALLMVKTALMIEHGMYDEDMFLYCEEMVLGIKFKHNQLKSLLVMNQTYDHMHSASISKSIKSERHKRQMMLDSFIYVLEKYKGISGIELAFAKSVKWLAKFENALMYTIKGYN